MPPAKLETPEKENAEEILPSPKTSPKDPLLEKCQTFEILIFPTEKHPPLNSLEAGM